MSKLLALTLFFIAASPTGFGTPPPEPAPLAPPPALTCGEDVRLWAVRPAPQDNEQEAAWIWNLAPVELDISDYELVVKRRRVRLTGQRIAPGARIEVSAPRLSNTGGEIRLVDPCGVVTSTLRWAHADAGRVYTAPPLVASVDEAQGR